MSGPADTGGGRGFAKHGCAVAPRLVERKLFRRRFDRGGFCVECGLAMIRDLTSRLPHFSPMFRAAKDALAGKSARLYLNELLSRYARLETLDIDSKTGRMELTCLLHGESAPITVTVGRYTIEQQGSDRFLRLGDCRCSRPWVQNILTDFVEEKSFPLPVWAAAALS